MKFITFIMIIACLLFIMVSLTAYGAGDNRSAYLNDSLSLKFKLSHPVTAKRHI